MSTAGKDADFIPIRTQVLLSVCPLKGDVFIRLGADKFVKLFQEGDVFENADWHKYAEEKKVEFLYLRPEQCAEFTEKYTTDLDRERDASPPIPVQRAFDLGSSVHEIAQAMGAKLGFTRDVQLLARSQVQLTLKAIGKSPSLSSILEELERQGGQYIAVHSTMVGYLACAIAAHLDWGSEATFHKLTLAAFMHDITLTNHALAECDTLAEVEQGNFTAQEKADFRAHPVKTAQIASSFTEVPPDVDSIILQHHEAGDGSGFPRGLTHTHIAPLSAIFSIAHAMTHFILKNGSRLDMEQFIAASGERFTRGNFKKVMATLTSLRLEKV